SIYLRLCRDRIGVPMKRRADEAAALARQAKRACDKAAEENEYLKSKREGMLRAHEAEREGMNSEWKALVNKVIGMERDLGCRVLQNNG
ncbi:hypothetical protein KIPB_008534, partial [Kipferlia bialata]